MGAYFRSINRVAKTHAPIRTARHYPSYAFFLRLMRRRSASRRCFSYFGIENVDLVFMTAVVGVAVRYGLQPNLLTSLIGSLSYNFFFHAGGDCGVLSCREGAL